MATATKVIKRKRRAVFVLLFLAFSCHHQDPFCWKIENSEVFGCFHSSKVYLSPETAVQGLEVEVAHSPSGLRLYLNLKFSPICSENGLIEINYQIDEKQFACLAHVFEGGQRLLLSDEARDRIITALSLGASVQIMVGMYQCNVPSLNFPIVYQKMLK